MKKKKKNPKNFPFCCDNWVQTWKCCDVLLLSESCSLVTRILLEPIRFRWSDFWAALLVDGDVIIFAVLWLEEEQLWALTARIIASWPIPGQNAVLYSLLMVPSSTGQSLLAKLKSFMDLWMEPQHTESLYNRAIEGFMRKEQRVEFVFKQLFSNGIYSPQMRPMCFKVLLHCVSVWKW